MSETHETAHAPGVHTSVLKPVSVKNTGKVALVFVADDSHNTFKLPPGAVHRLVPGNYRVQVDFTKPGPIVIVIAKIIYDTKLKTFDIHALDGVDGARFETNIDLEAVGPHHHTHGEAADQ